MTAQANDGKKASWIYKGEQPFDIICSTVGLADATQTLEYSKNYEGYWTGELFVKQLKETIIPAFEAAHGPGYQALIMVDNSQGHSAYALDALLVSHMNMNPGGKQALMCNGWFEQNGKRTIQSMISPPDHHKPTHHGQAKGLWRAGLHMQCKKLDGTNIKCDPNATNCCATCILELQPDLQVQTSLVQEVIEAASHCCIFLPKYHCKLNFIEFFWGAIKQHLHDNCDCTFNTLKKNMPLALCSVKIEAIRKRVLEQVASMLDA
ncbi:hypothetical protein K439DRAFT_1650080 [Ramaria rubella]|nr:hypothetical protein K439DRAFT_1650080 [Ramaria rubella]